MAFSGGNRLKSGPVAPAMLSTWPFKVRPLESTWISALLSDSHVLELGFFKIGGDPDFFEGHDGEQLLAGLHIHSNYDGLIYFAADRRDNFGVFEIELSLLEERHVFVERRRLRRGREPESKTLAAARSRQIAGWLRLAPAGSGLVDDCCAADSLARAAATVAVLALAAAKA